MHKKPQFWISIFLLVGAIIYLKQLSHGEVVPLRKSLREIPLEIGSWHGSEEGIDQKVIDILGVEDSIMRVYQKDDGAYVSLYVGYYESQRQGDTIHSPKHCLPGGGWQPVLDETVAFALAPDRTMEVNRYVIQKDLEKQQVLYWYQERGRVITSEYMAKMYLVFDAMTRNRTDGALVRIMAPVKDTVEDTLQVQQEFISLIMPYLRESLPE